MFNVTFDRLENGETKHYKPHEPLRGPHPFTSSTIFVNVAADRSDAFRKQREDMVSSLSVFYLARLFMGVF